MNFDDLEPFLDPDAKALANKMAAFLKSKKVSVKLPDDQEHLFTKALAEIFEDEEEDDMLNKIRNQIKTNHTSVNRSRQLIEGLV